jgi:Resolvase, N terminal domain
VKRQSPDIRSDAVSYLRVSSPGQAETDSGPEGISLPAQRKVITTRAKELSTVIVNEFTDPGKPGKPIEHRDAFREMIAYLKANPNVRYVIVHALSSSTHCPASPAIATTAPSCSSRIVLDLTCQHKNRPLLVAGHGIKVRPISTRPWSMWGCFSADQLQALIDLYKSGATANS